MTDFSKISTKDLEYISAGKLDKVSDAGLAEFDRQTKSLPPVEVVAEPSPVEYNPYAEGARSVAKGATFNWNDEIEAALRTGQISGKEYLQLRDQLRKQNEQFSKDYPATSTGLEIAGGMALPGAAALKPVTRGFGLAKDVALGTALGGLTGAGSAPEQANMADEATKEALMGGGISLGLGTGLRALAPAVRPEAAALRKQGVPLTPGAAFGGTIQKMEQSAESIPLLGQVVSGAREESYKGFNRAAYNKVLKNLDPALEVPKDMSGTDALKFVNQQISDRYTSIVPNVSLSNTSTFSKGLDAVKSKYSGGNMGEAQAKQLADKVDSLKAEISKNGVLSGNRVQAIKQDLAELSMQYSKATGSEGQLGNAFKDLQGLFMNSLRNQNPNYSKELKKADSAYADYLRVQSAMVPAKGAGAEKVFSPEQLRQAVKKEDQSKRKGLFAKGEARMQDLADTGTSVLGNKVPDSGTSSRAMAAALMAGVPAYVNPFAGAASAAAMAPYTQLGEKLLFAPRNPTFHEAVQRAKAASPFAIPGLLGLGGQ